MKDLTSAGTATCGAPTSSPPREQAISPRDRIAICNFFERPPLKVDVERDNDAIADAVFQVFPRKRDQLREVERALDRLPGRPSLPPLLEKLARALRGLLAAPARWRRS